MGAYPGFWSGDEDERKKDKQRMIDEMREDSRMSLWGLYRGEKMLGSMKMHDYDMTLFGTSTLAGGVGMVAVDLAHKRQHVAKEMIEFFVRHYSERGSSITILWPFRPDFYKKMGFGYMTRITKYRVSPDSLPKLGSARNISKLGPGDEQAVLEFYNQMAKRTHGMITKSEFGVKQMLSRERFVYGVREADRLTGYLSFAFRNVNKSNSMQNDLEVKEMVYEKPVLFDLLAFLRSQVDQADRIVFNSLDEHFYHLLADPRNGSCNFLAPVYHEVGVSGLGLMCRVTNVKNLFSVLTEHNWNNQTLRLKIDIKDTFIPENSGSTVLCFESGRAHLRDGSDFDVEASMDVASFSSLVMGDVDFATLVDYRLARISDEKYADDVTRVFKTRTRPRCITLF